MVDLLVRNARRNMHNIFHHHVYQKFQSMAFGRGVGHIWAWSRFKLCALMTGDKNIRQAGKMPWAEKALCNLKMIPNQIQYLLHWKINHVDKLMPCFTEISIMPIYLWSLQVGYFLQIYFSCPENFFLIRGNF